jgi:FkbM family methyltransferase
VAGEARVSLSLKTLYRNARVALWRRHGYRTFMDVPKDFLLRTTADIYARRGHPPISFPMALGLRSLPDKVYVRVANSDFLVLGEIFDRDEYAQVKNWSLPPDARIVDLGANIGLASVYFASLYPCAHVIAVEPDSENCGLIERNCRRLLKERRLKVYRAFVAASDGVAGIDRDVRAWAFHKVDTVDASHEAVTCLSMQTLLRESHFEQIDLLKCDIEGSERELFGACADWIGRVKHLIVETHNPYKVSDLYNDLRTAGWQFNITFELQEDPVGIAFLRGRGGNHVPPAASGALSSTS